MKVAYNTIHGLIVQEVETAPEFEHIVVDSEVLESLDGKIYPILSNGQIVEGANPEQIVEAQNPIINPISRMRFWLNVWRLLRLTEENIIDQPPP